jgi:hypothetical protein
LLADKFRINSRGFRDREFAADKGDSYRIVALGESTTMGATIAPDDQMVNVQVSRPEKIAEIEKNHPRFGEKVRLAMA